MGKRQQSPLTAHRLPVERIDSLSTALVVEDSAYHEPAKSMLPKNAIALLEWQVQSVSRLIVDVVVVLQATWDLLFHRLEKSFRCCRCESIIG